MNGVLKDQESRDRFAREIDKNFCVSAGAGAGKTTSIVQRIATIAEQSPEALKRLVVVTYGKPAAEELRIRARDSILQNLAGSGEIRSKLLGQFRHAFFGTIHSFCLKLVQEFGHTLGLPSEVQLLDSEELDEVWARFCESPDLEKWPGPDAELLRFVTFDDLLSLAKEASVTVDFATLERWAEERSEIKFPSFASVMAMEAARKNSVKTVQKNKARLRRWVEEYERGGGYVGLLFLKNGGGEFLAAYDAEMNPFLENLGKAAMVAASQLALLFRDYRVREGWMTYHDQVQWCRRLVEDPRVLEQLRSRESIVILDEAQDTDAAMFSILTELTRPPGSKIDIWPREGDGPLPGRFCFVGDEQQAIYGSRASLETFLDYVKAYREGRAGEGLEFSVTMRCSEQVISAVNNLFLHPIAQQSKITFRELHLRPGGGKGNAWFLEMETVEKEKPGVEELFELECERVAAFLKRSGCEGLGIRHWGEVAILCPRHSWLKMAADVFRRHGIPSRLYSEKRVEMELVSRSWPTALLYVLTHPWDRFEKMGVLREIFGVADTDLLKFHVSGDASPRLQESLGILAELHEGIYADAKKSLSRIVEEVLNRTRLAARIEIAGESLLQLEAFYREMLDAECEGATLTDWVEQLCKRLKRSTESVSEGEEEMQLLTCMKAKGLEWPVVIPLGLGREIGEKNMRLPRLVSEANVPAIRFRAKEKDEDDPEILKRREEYHRIFYVTLTRAREMLIIPDTTTHYRSLKKSFYDISFWEEAEGNKVFSLPVPIQTTVLPEILAEDGPEYRFMEDTSEAVRRSNAIPVRTLPYQLSHAEEQRNDLGTLEPAGVAGGVDYGLWWHETMQYFPWVKNPSEQAAYIEEVLGKVLLIGELHKRGVDELERWNQNEVLKELRASASFMPEFPFSYPRSGTEWMEGIIDLVAVTKSGKLWVVDWKTDRKRKGEKDFLVRLRETYQHQLHAYAEVLEKGMGRPVERVLLYSTEAGEVIDLIV